MSTAANTIYRFARAAALVWLLVPLTASPAPGQSGQDPAPTPSPPAPAVSDADSSAWREKAAFASKELERGGEILFKGQGARRFVEARAALTNAIDALEPEAAQLDDEARRTLSRALDYRAQCYLLQGENSEADADFALLVGVDPSYGLDPVNTSRKILERYRKIQASRVAFVTFQVEPADAEIVWNGRKLGSSPPPDLAVLAGSFVLSARRACYGTATVEGTIPPGEHRAVPAHLDPVARAVRFETSPAGFDVELDGTAAGVTAAPAEAGAGAAQGAEGASPGAGRGALEITCVPAGEHKWTVRRDCYEETRGTVAVEIDFVDRAPVVVPLVSPAKREVVLDVVSDVPGASVWIEGEKTGTVPLAGYALCPGRKRLEVRTASHLVWAAAVDLDRAGTATIHALARPSLRLVMTGAPPEAAAVAPRVSRLATFNVTAPRSAQEDSETLASLDAPAAAAGADPAALRPRLGADLVLAVDVVDNDLGPAVRLRLASALAGVTETTVCAPPAGACIGRALDALESPWPRREPLTGLLVDGSSGGESGLLLLGARGPAQAAGVREGDRIVALGPGGDGKIAGKGGSRPGTFSALRAAAASVLGSSGEGRLPLVLDRGGKRSEVSLAVRAAPVIAAPGGSPIPLARLLATAEFEASVLPPGEARNAALLNLATTLLARGEPRRALDLALERDGWADNVDGAAAKGAARFLAGRCYEEIGDVSRAAAAMKQAAADSLATFWDPDGIPVAPIARLKLLALTGNPASPTPVSKDRSN